MEVTDDDVRGMVRALHGEWEVESIDRSDHGTDFVATLDVRMPDLDGTEVERRVVLKATTADLVDPVVARSEPRLLELVGEETSIPVPSVYGYCDDHDRYPAPFYLMAHVEGENFEGRVEDLPGEARDRIVREAGWNLGMLHDLGPLPASGRVGVRDDRLLVLDTEEHPRYADGREWARAYPQDALDALSGEEPWFPDLADDPERFADLVPDLQTCIEDRVSGTFEPDPPTYCHRDYRYGNLLVDPGTGNTRAVLDWANLVSAEPAYNLASAESLLLAPDRDDEDRTRELRETFRSAYAEIRDDWTFDRAVRERMDLYHLFCRLGAMACLPLWHQDATPEERDERAAEHRAFVEEYL